MALDARAKCLRAEPGSIEEQVKQYVPLVRQVAARFARRSGSLSEEDLVAAGLVRVWRELVRERERGVQLFNREEYIAQAISWGLRDELQNSSLARHLGTRQRRNAQDRSRRWAAKGEAPPERHSPELSIVSDEVLPYELDHQAADLDEAIDVKREIVVPRCPKVAEDKVRRVVQLRGEGVLLSEIGDQVGLSRSTVHLVLNAPEWAHVRPLGGFRGVRTSRRLTPEQALQIIRLRRAGWSFRRISKAARRAVSSIQVVLYGDCWKHLRRKNEFQRIRQCRKFTADEIAEIMKLRKAGVHIERIAQQIGRTVGVIYKTLFNDKWCHLRGEDFRRRRHRRVTPEVRTQIKHMRAKGLSPRAIAESMGFGLSTVGFYLDPRH